MLFKFSLDQQLRSAMQSQSMKLLHQDGFHADYWNHACSSERVFSLLPSKKEQSDCQWTLLHDIPRLIRPSLLWRIWRFVMDVTDQQTPCNRTLGNYSISDPITQWPSRKVSIMKTWTSTSIHQDDFNWCPDYKQLHTILIAKPIDSQAHISRPHPILPS